MQVYPARSLPGVAPLAMELCKSIPQEDKTSTHSKHPFICVSMKGVCWIRGDRTLNEAVHIYPAGGLDWHLFLTFLHLCVNEGGVLDLGSLTHNEGLDVCRRVMSYDIQTAYNTRVTPRPVARVVNVVSTPTSVLWCFFCSPLVHSLRLSGTFQSTVSGPSFSSLFSTD